MAQPALSPTHPREFRCRSPSVRCRPEGGSAGAAGRPTTKTGSQPTEQERPAHRSSPKALFRTVPPYARPRRRASRTTRGPSRYSCRIRIRIRCWRRALPRAMPRNQRFALDAGCLGGKGSADLALSGVGRIAIVRFYRYVDDVEALELSGEFGWQQVGGSSVVGQHTQGVHALAVGVD